MATYTITPGSVVATRRVLSGVVRIDVDVEVTFVDGTRTFAQRYGVHDLRFPSTMTAAEILQAVRAEIVRRLGAATRHFALSYNRQVDSPRAAPNPLSALEGVAQTVT